MNVSEKFFPQREQIVDHDVIDLSQLLGTLWRRKLWILAAGLLFLLAGVYYAFSVATPKYKATTDILLNANGAELVDLSAVLPSLGADSEAINTEVEVLKSRALIERVVKAADLTRDPEFNSTLRPPSLKSKLKSLLTGAESKPPNAQFELTTTIKAVQERMNVRNLPSTYVLQITVISEAADKSVMLADLIAEQYVLYQMDVKFEATRDASQWLSSRVADLKIELEQAEARVSEFSSSSKVVSLESVQALERQVKDLRDRRDGTASSALIAEQKVLDLQALTDASAEEKAQKADDARLLTILRTQGEGEAFDARFEQVLTTARQQAERTSLQATSLSNSISSMEAEIAAQSEELIELQQLSREAEASRLLYEYFLGRLKETSAQEGIQQADSRLLSRAVLPEGPAEPKKSLILIVSLMLGVMFGSGGALIWEMRQNNYRQAKDIEDDTGIPVMGQVPLLPARSRKAGIEYLSEKPSSAAAEAIRNLRTSVLLSGIDHTPKVIMSTSSLPGEGKTTISFAMAHNLVGLGKKVLLVEGDIRRQIFSQYLGAKDAKGMMSVLSGDTKLEDAVIFNELIGADILVAEETKVNAADVLSSDSFAKFLERAREIYDFVIVDTPPVLVVPDARVIAQNVDAVLFTVRWDKTSKTQVRDALRMFETVGVSVSGIVLNQIDGRGMKRYGYGDSYGAYSSYGKKYYNN